MQVTNEMVEAARIGWINSIGKNPHNIPDALRAALEAALGVCKELPAAEVLERVAKDQASDPSTDDMPE